MQVLAYSMTGNEEWGRHAGASMKQFIKQNRVIRHIYPCFRKNRRVRLPQDGMPEKGGSEVYLQILEQLAGRGCQRIEEK